MKAKNYSLRCNSETSLRKSGRSQRRLWGDVFNQSPGRRLRDLQISPLRDVSETLNETHLRYIHAGWECKTEGNSFIRNLQKEIKLLIDLRKFLQTFLLARETSSQSIKNVYFHWRLFLNNTNNFPWVKILGKWKHAIVFIYLKQPFGEWRYWYSMQNQVQ